MKRQRLSDPHISVVVVTKNRSRLLLECLTSLSRQSVLPYEVIIVDNASTDNTASIAAAYAKNVSFPVRYKIEQGKGYPVVYNRGIQEARYAWVAFIDDDCVANKDWLLACNKTIIQHGFAAAIAGQSDTYYNHNIYSLATLFNLEYWKKGKIKGSMIYDLEILDNKNIVYNRSFLLQHHIRFDERRVTFANGAAEDCDLGMQITRAGGTAQYSKTMRVSHKDPTNWNRYFSKTIQSTLSYLAYNKQWESYRKTHVPTPKRPRVFEAARRFVTRRRLGLWQICIFFCLLYTTYIIKRVVIFCHRLMVYE